MRSPAVVFSLFAVSALSPSVVYGSPVPNGVAHHNGSSDHHRAPSAVAARGLGFLNEVFARADTTHTPRPTYTSKPKVASIAGVELGYAPLPYRLPALTDERLYTVPNDGRSGRSQPKSSLQARRMLTLNSAFAFRSSCHACNLP